MPEAKAIVRHLKSYAELERRIGARSLGGWLLESGEAKAYERKPPEGVSMGPSKECFGNATHVALWDERYTYCEGYGYPPEGIPCLHAWVVDREDGKAIDVTWREDDVCGFCLGDGVVPLEVDEDDERYGEDESCDWCKGSGKSPLKVRSLEGAEYYGIEFSDEYLRRTILDQGFYGLLERYATDKEVAA